jgi:hypothetical protein
MPWLPMGRPGSGGAIGRCEALAPSGAPASGRAPRPLADRLCLTLIRSSLRLERLRMSGPIGVYVRDARFAVE